MVVAGLFLIALIVATLIGALILPILAFYIILSGVTFLVYALDKRAARRRRRRVPEFNLHVLALCGGWPGALVAQEMLRHKTRKTGFRVTFWITVALNCALLLWML